MYCKSIGCDATSWIQLVSIFVNKKYNCDENENDIFENRQNF